MTGPSAPGDGAGTLPTTPGTNTFVVDGSGRDVLRFSLSRLPAVDRRLVVSSDAAAADVAELAAEVDDGPPLDVLDCTDGAESLTNANTPVETTVTDVAPAVPDVGEATVDALDRLPASTTAGVCVHAVSTLVARSTVQQTYKLLYVLAQRVREHGHVAFYTWHSPAEERTLRILGQALDYRVALDGTDGPTVRSLAEVGDDG